MKKVMMKKPVMILAIILSAVLLVVASVMGTLAFLASSTAVSNTFTVGDVGIEMFETLTDKHGADIEEVPGKKTSDGNSYELIPGKSYIKDPTIYVKDSSVSSYLFVKVKNGIKTIEAEGNTMKDQMIANGWQLIKDNASGEELYLYVGEGNATAEKKTAAVTAATIGGNNTQTSFDIFESFTVKNDVDCSDYAGAKVTLTAFAIQVEGYTDGEGGAPIDGLYGYQRAWNAIVGRFPFESGTAYTAA